MYSQVEVRLLNSANFGLISRDYSYLTIRSRSQAVGKKDKCAFKSYVELSSDNWKKLKELFEDMNVPAIPHLGNLGI